MATTPEWFVYWSVAAADVEPAVEALQRWHERLRRDHPALRSGRYIRPDARPDRPDRHTVMETYAWDGGSALHEQALAAWADVLRNEGDELSSPWRLGPRHLEIFQRLP